MILGSSNIQSAPSIVAKIDIDGNINEAFSLIDSFDSTYHYFNFNSIDVWDDSSFIFGARTTYIPDSLGVSKDSRVDFTLIKFSSIDRSVQWVTSVDYKNNLDQEMTTCLFETNFYFFKMTSTNQDFCLGFLSIVDGKMQSNICLNLPVINNSFQKLDFMFISHNWIFTLFPTVNLNYINIAFFDTGNIIWHNFNNFLATLNIKKVIIKKFILSNLFGFIYPDSDYKYRFFIYTDQGATINYINENLDYHCHNFNISSRLSNKYYPFQVNH